MLKNSGYLFSATGISAVLSMVQSILVARLLGVAGFGVLGTITMFTSTINKFASFRMGELVIKYVGYYTEHEDHPRAAAIFKAAAITEMAASFVAFGLVLLLAPVGAKYLAKDTSLSNLFIIYGLIVLANLIAESSTGLLQIFDRFRRIALLDVLESILTLGIIGVTYVTTILSCPDCSLASTTAGLSSADILFRVLMAYLLGKTLGALGKTIAAMFEASRRWGSRWWKTPLGLLRTQVRELAHFAVSTNISDSLSLINKDSELLWVSLLRTPTETGYYKLALTLANIVQMPINPLPQATYPELSRETARQNWGNVRHVLRQGSLMAGTYTLATAFGLAIISIPLIYYIYKPEFMPAYPALLILLLGFLPANTFYWRRVALLSLGRPDFPAKLNLILATFKLLGIALLVPRYGYLANAALLAAFYWTGSLISVLKVRSLITDREVAP